MAAPNARLNAQQPAPATPPAASATTATAVGSVFDSLRMRPLAGAVVRLDTTEISTTADSDGRYRLEGIPPGRHYLRVEHAIIDTIGITLRSAAEPFAAGQTVAAELATPSPEGLLKVLCSAAWRTRGPAALMGRVRDADTGLPAVGAKVSLVWYEVEISSGLRRTPRVREATIGQDGTYRICGLPAQLDGKVQVLKGPLTSGEIAISFGQDLLFLRSMSIAQPVVAVAEGGDTTAVRAPNTGTARLTGRVLNNAGRPLAGARVQLEGTTRAATTRANGDFVLDSLPAGTQNVSVRLIGFAPVEEAVDLVSREPRSVTIKMTEFVPVLEGVRVTAARERALDQVGFARRKRTGMGHYLEGDQINTNGLYFSDVMRSVPGIRVMQVEGRQMLASSRDPNGCVSIWVDGTAWQQMQPGDIDDFVKPHELAAIEVYNSSTTPGEFQSIRGSSCTTIVAWTYRRLDRDRNRRR
jgi:hypothetical protein